MDEQKSLIKVEGNLCEYPFFLLSKTKEKITLKTYEFEDVTSPKGDVLKRKFVVKGIDGIPTSFDQDVVMAILKIGTRTKTLLGDISLTLYEITKTLRNVSSKRVKESIRRLQSTAYDSTHAVLVKETNDIFYVEDLFSILDNAHFREYKPGENKRKARECSYIRFNKYFLQNFVNHYYKYIDFNVYQNLRTPSAKKLYLFLEKKKFEKEKFEICIKKLAAVLPLETKRTRDAKKVIKQACERLIQQGVIKGYGFKDDKITFSFPSYKKKEPSALPPSPERLEGEKGKLLDDLLNFGITERIAKELIKNCKLEDIKKQIEALPFRKADNPQGVLVKSIVENWALPSKYLEEKKKQQEELDAIKKEEDRTQKEAEEEVQQKKIEEIKISLSNEELRRLIDNAKEGWEKETENRLGPAPLSYIDATVDQLICDRYFVKEKSNL